MLFPLIKEILSLPPDGRELKIRGWVRTKRELKNLVFIELNDGSCLRGIQCTFDRGAEGREAGNPDAADPAREQGAAPHSPDVLDALGTGAAAEI
ncbi:MAG: asparagine--tRNA ligase, partial [Treponema sp.]|nr:asparagine--tRNA ligase [Treponema sp.]